MQDHRIDDVQAKFRNIVSDLRDLQSTSAQVEHRGVAIAITHVETAELWFNASIVAEDQTDSPERRREGRRDSSS